jgi:hypothetical protein
MGKPDPEPGPDLARLTAALGVSVRAPTPDEFGQIEAIARSSFPVPGRLMADPENRAHYHAGWVAEGGLDGRQVLLAVGPDGLVAAYAYYLTHDGSDVHLRELAAEPADPAAKRPLAGTLLLGYVLAEGDRRGCRVASLNVLAAHRRDAPDPDRNGWRDPCGYYQKFGFAVVPPPTRAWVRASRTRRDAWLEADPAAALAAVRAFLLPRAGTTGRC